jgi:ubiquinone/menaquinone biosynthesis C-methylase UbiE
MSLDVERFSRFCSSDLGRKVMDREAEYVRAELKGHKRVLDVGCGIGSFEQRLSSLDIVGVDSSEEMLEEARKRSEKTFLLCKAERLKAEDATFDAVFTVTTLEFLDDYQEAVREMARVTRPGGKILAMILNPKSQYFKDRLEKPRGYFKRIQHTNVESIRECIRRFYTVTKQEYFLGIRGEHVFDTDDVRYASLYAVVGVKKRALDLYGHYQRARASPRHRMESLD